MQSLLDSLCRCFGTPGGHPVDFDTLSQDPIQNQRTPSTPDMKRRASRLALQDKHWDALFSDPVRDGHSSSSSSKKKSVMISAERKSRTIEQAQAVAQAKLSANLHKSHKRKRSTSRDDIFRSKKPLTAADALLNNKQRIPANTCQPGGANPLGRFLSNHPALANSLCFATPVRDSTDEEPDTVPLRNVNSVMSGNTAGDETTTSTLYYEATKLSALRPERNPPMPLFPDHSVDCPDDIRHVMVNESNKPVNSYVHDPKDTVLDLDDCSDDDDAEQNNGVEHSDDDQAPQLTCSTESSRESDR